MASTVVVRAYSPHFQSLSVQSQKCYGEKLDCVGVNVDDPYNLYKEAVKIDEPPLIEYPDIFNYLINAISPYMREQLQAYKSLEGYVFLLSG